MRDRIRPRSRWIWLLALPASVLVHLGAVALINHVPQPVLPRPPSPPRPPTSITLVTPPPKARPQSPAAPANPTQPSKPVAPPPPPPGQVVKLPPSQSTKPPRESRFLSEEDHQANRETRARRTSSDAPAAHVAAVAPSPEPPPPPPQPPGGTRHGEDGQDGKPDEKARADQGQLAAWTPAPQGEQRAPGAWGSKRGEHDESHGKATGLPQLSQLMLSPSAASRIAAGAPANDALADVAEGDGTYLNARRWKYAAFFNRLADGIRRQWKPGELLMRRDPDGTRHGISTRETTLQLTLDRGGTLLEVRVVRPSGVDYLDEEAVRATREAAPFPNPPPALFDGQPHLSFWFGFIVTMEQPDTLRLVPFLPTPP